MKYQEIKNLTSHELRTRHQVLERSLFETLMKKKMQRLSNIMEIRSLRRDLARLRTAMTHVEKLEQSTGKNESVKERMEQTPSAAKIKPVLEKRSRSMREKAKTDDKKEKPASSLEKQLGKAEKKAKEEKRVKEQIKVKEQKKAKEKIKAKEQTKAKEQITVKEHGKTKEDGKGVKTKEQKRAVSEGRKAQPPSEKGLKPESIKKQTAPRQDKKGTSFLSKFFRRKK